MASGLYHCRTGTPFAAKTLIFDSAPKVPQFRRDLHALFVPARTMGWARWIPYAVSVVTITAFFWFVVNFTPFWRESVTAPREGINDERLLDRSCVRAYVYNDADQVEDARDAESHAAQAQERGFGVVLRKLRGEARHVQMWKGEGVEVAFWGVIGRIWKMGLGLK